MATRFTPSPRRLTVRSRFYKRKVLAETWVTHLYLGGHDHGIFSPSGEGDILPALTWLLKRNTGWRLLVWPFSFGLVLGVVLRVTRELLPQTPSAMTYRWIPGRRLPPQA